MLRSSRGQSGCNICVRTWCRFVLRCLIISLWSPACLQAKVKFRKWSFLNMSLLWRCMVNLIKIHPSHVLWGSVFSTPTVTHVPTSYSNMLRARKLCQDWGRFWVECHKEVCMCTRACVWVYVLRSWSRRLFWKQSGNTKWNVAFVKNGGAAFIKALTPCQISGRCFQRGPAGPSEQQIHAEISFGLNLKVK